MVRQEEIPQPLSLRLLSQLVDDSRSFPSIPGQLCFVDPLSGYALILNPVIDLLDLLNGNGPEFCFDPGGYSGEGWAVHLAVGCHCEMFGDRREMCSRGKVKELDKEMPKHWQIN